MGEGFRVAGLGEGDPLIGEMARVAGFLARMTRAAGQTRREA